MYAAPAQRKQAGNQPPEDMMDPDEEAPLFFEFEVDEEGYTLCTNMTDEQVVEMLVEQFIQRNTQGMVH